MNLRSPYTCILWDMDGTIVDASEGVLSRLQRTLTHFEKTPPTADTVSEWIGPPLYDSFQKHANMTPAEATEAVSFYRELGKADGYTTHVKVYPGVAPIIEELAEAKVPQGTASSKPEVQVVALLDFFGLSQNFTAITGSTEDEKTLARKSDIIREALRRFEEKGVDTSKPIMIGDRHHDIEGGLTVGVPVIFVRWGFSRPNEGAGATAYADTPEELRALLINETA